MEGHFIVGYGDRSGPSQIQLVPGATEEAVPAVADRPDTQKQIEQVLELIDGFTWPYGLELLTSVHWVAHHSDQPAATLEEAIDQVHRWTPRKGRLFTNDHIATAWNHLRDHGWLS
jgi:hypothetical protein